MRKKLDALLAGKGVVSGAEWKKSVEETRRRRAEGAFEAERVLPGDIVENDAGRFLLVRYAFPLDKPQGIVPLGSVLDAVPGHIALSASDEELLDFDPRSTCFIDTETTGLAGGAGTVAFLIGTSYFQDNAFILEQCMMRDYDEEPAMLHHLAERFRVCDTVVSYNGKSFDLPLLRTRFIQNRIPFPLDGAAHFDLLHVARRFWKRRIRDCSLANVERAVLQLHRQGDIPSHLIPQTWLDYIHSRDARKLKPVFYHHRMDIMSLVALTGWVSRCLAEPEGGGFEHGEDRLSLLHLHFREKRYPEAVETGRRLLAGETDTALRRACLEMLAFAYKRLRQWEEMVETWDLMLTEFPGELGPRLELAKYHEHTARDLETAEALCLQAVGLLQTRCDLGRATELELRELGAFRHRLERIRRKRDRQGPHSGQETFD